LSAKAIDPARRGLSVSPTVVQEQLKVDLPDERDQLHTRVTPRFAELRTHVYEQIQAAKRGTTSDIKTDTPPPH
jgi:NitT/TauT family transport system ATP-binding protein